MILAYLRAAEMWSVEGEYGATVGETRPEEPGVLIVPRARIYDLVSGLRTPIRALQLHRCVIRGRTDGSIRLRADLLQKPLASRGASTDEYTAQARPATARDFGRLIDALPEARDGKVG